MTKYNDNLTQARLKELLHYNPDTGVLIWLITPSPKVKAGDVGGYLAVNGYIKLKVDRISYSAHRLAFLYMEGKLPPDEIDHINRIRNDNRWCNLRHSNRRLNSENRINNTKFIGVYYNKNDKRWRAYSTSTCVEKKQIYLGQYLTHLAACYRRWSYDVMSDIA